MTLPAEIQTTNNGTNGDTNLPPLSIAYFLGATASIAAVLGLGGAFIDENPQIPIGWLVMFSWVAGSIGTALGMQLLLWNAFRRFRGQSSLLVEPGAKFAVILGVQGFVSLLSHFFVRIFFGEATSSIRIYLSLLLLIEGIGFAIILFGLYWIRGATWRTLLIGRAATSYRSMLSMAFYFFGGFPGSMYLPLIASAARGLVAILHFAGLVMLVASFIEDRRWKRKRHWTHHLGALLFCLSLLSTWSSFAWELLQNGW